MSNCSHVAADRCCFVFFVTLCMASVPPVCANGPWISHGPLRVAADGHYLEHEDGTPFLLLADTAWHLRTLSEPDIDAYLQDREEKQFNVVMADFRRRWNPLDSADTEAQWGKNDYIVDQAAERGLYVVVIAGWGSSLQALSSKEMRDYRQLIGTR